MKYRKSLLIVAACLLASTFYSACTVTNYLTIQKSKNETDARPFMSNNPFYPHTFMDYEFQQEQKDFHFEVTTDQKVYSKLNSSYIYLKHKEGKNYPVMEAPLTVNYKNGSSNKVMLKSIRFDENDYIYTFNQRITDSNEDLTVSPDSITSFVVPLLSNYPDGTPVEFELPKKNITDTEMKEMYYVYKISHSDIIGWGLGGYDASENRHEIGLEKINKVSFYTKGDPSMGGTILMGMGIATDLALLLIAGFIWVF